MVDRKKSSVELNEQSGIQFSLSFLIQLVGTVILAVWGYSQLDARISQGEHLSMMHSEKIGSIEADMKAAQDKPIPSDYVQNTTLAAHERELSDLRARMQVLEKRLYEYKIKTVID